MQHSIQLGFEAYKLFHLIESNPEGANLDQICSATGKAKGAAGKAVSRLRLKDLIFTDIQDGEPVYKATGAAAEIRPQDAEAWEAFVADQKTFSGEALTPSPIEEAETEEITGAAEAYNEDQPEETGNDEIVKNETGLHYGKFVILEDREETPVAATVEETEGEPGAAVNAETGEETAAGEPLPPVKKEKPAKQPAKPKKSESGTDGRAKYDYSGWPVQKGDAVTYLRGKKGNQTTHEGTVTRLMVYAQQKGEKVVKIQPAEGGKETTVRLKLVSKASK